MLPDMCIAERKRLRSGAGSSGYFSGNITDTKC